MKLSKTSFLRNCISGWNVRIPCGANAFACLRYSCYLCTKKEDFSNVSLT